MESIEKKDREKMEGEYEKWKKIEKGEKEEEGKIDEVNGSDLTHLKRSLYFLQKWFVCGVAAKQQQR